MRRPSEHEIKGRILETLPRRRHTGWLLLSTALLFGACTPVDNLPMMEMEQPTDPGTMPMNPVPKDAIGLTMGPIKVDPGSERTVCITRKFEGLDKGIDVTEIGTRQSNSHHVIVYRYKKGEKPQVGTEPKNCQALDLFGGGGIDKAPLFIGESSDPKQNILKLPPGVAYRIEPDDYYMIEMHIVNASPKEVSPTAEVYLVPAADGAGKTEYADMFFFNNMSGLSKKYDGKQSGVPPMTTTTLDPDFATLRSSFKIFGITTHQHRHGVGVSVSKSTGANKPGTFLFENKDWQHPDLYRLPDDKPMTFAQGEGLRFVCTYNNTSDNYLRFGESGLDDEMCIIWGYYYPSAGFQLSWH